MLNLASASTVQFLTCSGLHLPILQLFRVCLSEWTQQSPGLWGDVPGAPVDAGSHKYRALYILFFFPRVHTYL